MSQFVQPQDIGAIVPEMELAVFGMFLLIFDLMVENKRRLGLHRAGGHCDVPGCFLFRLWNVQFYAYGGALILDPLCMFFKLIFLVGGRPIDCDFAEVPRH